MSSLLVGRVKGVCAAECRYDADATCVVCNGLDPDRYLVFRVPTAEEEKRERAIAAFRDVAEKVGLDPDVLQVVPLDGEA